MLERVYIPDPHSSSFSSPHKFRSIGVLMLFQAASGSGRSPAAKRFLLHFQLKMKSGNDGFE